jgi:hypothetical protein
MSITPKKVVTKKVVKKVAALKAAATTVKKPATKKTSTTKAKTLVYADNSQSFWTKDGQILNSLPALHDALAIMDKAVYAHHVNKDHHDFAQWVEIVLVDAPCAAELKKAKTAATAKSVVAKHLKSYSK